VLKANCTNGRLLQFLARHARNVTQSYEDSTMNLEGLMTEPHLVELRAFGKDVVIVSPKLAKDPA